MGEESDLKGVDYGNLAELERMLDEEEGAGMVWGI